MTPLSELFNDVVTMMGVTVCVVVPTAPFWFPIVRAIVA